MNSNEESNYIVLKDSCSHSHLTANYRRIPLIYTSTQYQCHSHTISLSFSTYINVISTRYQYHLHPVSMSFVPTINSYSTPYQCHLYPVIIPALPTNKCVLTHYRCHFYPISTVSEQTNNSGIYLLAPLFGTHSRIYKQNMSYTNYNNKQYGKYICSINTQHHLNTAKLKNGIYFISVRNNTETFKSKFTIIK